MSILIKSNNFKDSFFLLLFINIFLLLILILSTESNLKEDSLKNVFATIDNDYKVNFNQILFETKNFTTQEYDQVYKNPITYEQNLNMIVSQILPPNITLFYNNSEYFGKVISYKFREGYTFAELQEELRTFNLGNVLFSLNTPAFDNLSNSITNNTITIKNDSELKFIILEYPERLQPSSLSINSYKVNEDENTLQNPRVLQIVNNANELNFKVNLTSGRYVLIATATWIPESLDHVGGYIMHGFNINIKH